MPKNPMFKVLFLIFAFLSIMAVRAEDFSWHKPTPCFGCHAETLGADYGSEECGKCHDYGLNVDRLQSNHDPNICKACHMGKTVVNASEKEIFHSGHNEVKCAICHTEDNFTVIKIKNKGFECVSCHGNQIHTIHIKNLNNACPICHGSWAKGKIYSANAISTSANTSLTNSKIEKFTIFALLKDIINVFLGVI